MKFELDDYHRNISDEELLQDVIRVSKIYEKDTLTKKEYQAHGKYGGNTFDRHFGGWNNTLELCGLRVNDSQRHAAQGAHNYGHITDQQLIDDLVRVANILGTPTFSSREYAIHGEWSRGTYFNRFKTWNDALKAAGLQPYVQVSGRKIETEKILEEIERIWVKLGRQPTTTDIRNGISIYSLNTFARHFGSWRKALVAFVNSVNADESSDSPDRPDAKSHEPVLRDVLHSSKSHIPVVGGVHQSTTVRHKTHREPNLRLRFKVFVRDHFSCCVCGASPSKDSSVELHVDHIKPWSKGGETVLENLQTLCSKCNLGKSDLS